MNSILKAFLDNHCVKTRQRNIDFAWKFMKHKETFPNTYLLKKWFLKGFAAPWLRHFPWINIMIIWKSNIFIYNNDLCIVQICNVLSKMSVQWSFVLPSLIKISENLPIFLKVVLLLSDFCNFCHRMTHVIIVTYKKLMLITIDWKSSLESRVQRSSKIYFLF